MRTSLIALACVAGGCVGGGSGGPTSATMMGTFAGTVPGLFGVNVSATTATATAPTGAQLQALGATRARIEFAVAAGDLDGAFAQYDALVADYGAHGLQILFVLDGATADGFVGATQPDWTDGYVVSFAARAGAIAAHYATNPWRGQLAGFEIWSDEDLACPAPTDPNATPAICNFIPSDRYAQLFGAAAGAIHAALPGSTAIVGGLAAAQPKYVSDLKQQLGGKWDDVDALGLHPIGTWPSDTAENGLPPIAPLLDALDRAAGGTRNFYVTRWGTDNQAIQDSLVAAFYDYFGAKPGKVAQAYLEDYAAAAFHQAAARPAAIATATRLHGAVLDPGGAPLAGVQVTALGLTDGDFHATRTGANGGYSFDALNAASQYNLTVNAQLAGNSLASVDARYALAERDHVTLALGPDGWHAEQFVLASALAPPPSVTNMTPRLRGVLDSNNAGQSGLTVMAFGHDLGDFHQTTTDANGVYEFTDLDPLSEYDVVVNATLNGGRPVAIDALFRGELRRDVALIAGPDGWHGEDFDISPIHPPTPPPPTPH